MATKEEIFMNIKSALREVFGDIESYHVEHVGKDIYLQVPSEYFITHNWNSLGLNGSVNVLLHFENFHPLHPEDKKVKVRMTLQDFYNTDRWYGLNLANVKTSFKNTVNNKMVNAMSNYFSSIKNDLIIKGDEPFRRNYEITIILDNNDDEDTAIENAKLLQKVITEFNEKATEVVEDAIEDFKQEMNAEEDEYQRLKAQRHATTVAQSDTISNSYVISQIREKDLSQEQMQQILDIVQ